jgi:hypothetical protein
MQSQCNGVEFPWETEQGEGGGEGRGNERSAEKRSWSIETKHAKGRKKHKKMGKRRGK